MGLFIIMVGGIYLIIKWISETSSKEASDRYCARTHDRVKQMGIGADGADDDIMKRLDARDMSLLEEISSELTEVYGANWKDKYRIGVANPTQWTMSDSPWFIAYNILWSKRGKASQSLVGSWLWKFYGPLDSEKSKAKLAMCKIIERNMRNFYPDFRIILQPAIVPWENYKRRPFDQSNEYEVGVEYNAARGKYGVEFRYLW